MRNNTIHENISEDMLAADGGISLETLIRSKGLAISSLALDNQDVLILPGDGAVTTSQANVFSEYSKEVRALFNDVGIDAKLYDDGRDKRQLILKSAEIVLPILLFIE